MQQSYTRFLSSINLTSINQLHVASRRINLFSQHKGKSWCTDILNLMEKRETTEGTRQWQSSSFLLLPFSELGRILALISISTRRHGPCKQKSYSICTFWLNKARTEITLIPYFLHSCTPLPIKPFLVLICKCLQKVKREGLAKHASFGNNTR